MFHISIYNIIIGSKSTCFFVCMCAAGVRPKYHYLHYPGNYMHRYDIIEALHMYMLQIIPTNVETKINIVCLRGVPS